MNVRHFLLSSTIAISCLAAAAYADAAKADGVNPYLPGNAAVVNPINPADYCSIQPIGAWTCQQAEYFQGGGGGQKNVQRAFGDHEPHAKPKKV